MVHNPRPFWQILVIGMEHGGYVPLNCDECFLILEFLAEEAIQGMEERYLLQAVRQHLDRCPRCREHHLQRLEEIEAKFYIFESKIISEENARLNDE